MKRRFVYSLVIVCFCLIASIFASTFTGINGIINSTNATELVGGEICDDYCVEGAQICQIIFDCDDPIIVDIQSICCSGKGWRSTCFAYTCDWP